MSEVLESPAAVQAAELVKVALLQAAPYNTRTEADYGDVQGLAESIKAEGLLQPLTVRPVGAKLEVVCGHRRLRALQLLGWTEVPVVTRALSDDEARIVATTENLQRENINPIAQAEGFQALTRKPFNLSPEDVGRRVGKPVWFVRQALQVLMLPEKVIAAVRTGALAWKSVAQLMRIEDRKVREEVALELLPDKYGGRDHATAAQARAIVFEHLLALKDAPFDVADATLVPDAGTCGACPFRSGAQAKQVSLFSDVKGDEADTCTKPSCWTAKANAAHERKAEVARKAGHPTWPNSKQLFFDEQHGHRAGKLKYNGPVVDVDEADAGGRAYDLGMSHDQRRSVRALLGDKLPPEAIAVVQDPAGRTRFVAKVGDVKRALEKAGLKTRQSYGPGQPGVKSEAEKASDRKKRLANEIRMKSRREVYAQLLAKATERKAIDASVAVVLFGSAHHRAKGNVEDSLGFEDVKKYLAAGKGSIPEVLGQLAVEIAVGSLDFGWDEDAIEGLAKAWGVDAAGIEKAISDEATGRYKEREAKRAEAAKREQLKAKKRPKAPSKPSATKPAAKSKPKAKRKK